VEPYLREIGFKKADTTFIPISGLEGINLVKKSDNEALNSWYRQD
jgi:translation elongation factor EF-1alpha